MDVNITEPASLFNLKLVSEDSFIGGKVYRIHFCDQELVYLGYLKSNPLSNMYKVFLKKPYDLDFDMCWLESKDYGKTWGLREVL